MISILFCICNPASLSYSGLAFKSEQSLVNTKIEPVLISPLDLVTHVLFIPANMFVGAAVCHRAVTNRIKKVHVNIRGSWTFSTGTKRNSYDKAGLSDQGE